MSKELSKRTPDGSKRKRVETQPTRSSPRFPSRLPPVLKMARTNSQQQECDILVIDLIGENDPQCNGNVAPKNTNPLQQQHQAQLSEGRTNDELFDPVKLVQQYENDERLARALQQDDINRNREILPQIGPQVFGNVNEINNGRPTFETFVPRFETQPTLHPDALTLALQCVNDERLARELQRRELQFEAQHLLMRPEVSASDSEGTTSVQPPVGQGSSQPVKLNPASSLPSPDREQKFGEKFQPGNQFKTVEQVSEGKYKGRKPEVNDVMNERLICKICMEKEGDVVFQPCGHLAACQGCAKSLRKCPVCRGIVLHNIKIYIS